MQDEFNGEENFDFEDEVSGSPKPHRNIFCEEARYGICIVAGNYRKQGNDTETLNSGWCGEPIKHNRIVNGISSSPQSVHFTALDGAKRHN